MAATYDDAVAALYQAPHETFVAERKRLSGELKVAGDKNAATQLAKLARPPLSAWTVNQLWWRARDEFDALFAAAARLRQGDLAASTDHRDALLVLRTRAATILAGNGHAATESTLRRIAMTVSALAAAGGFAPDVPGALTADRDPPGFDSMALAASLPLPRIEPAAPPAAVASAHPPDDLQAARDRRAAEEAERARRQAEQAERARREGERARLRAELSTATAEVEAARRETDTLRRDLAAAEKRLRRAQATASDLQAQLARLDGDP